LFVAAATRVSSLRYLPLSPVDYLSLHLLSFPASSLSLEMSTTAKSPAAKPASAAKKTTPKAAPKAKAAPKKAPAAKTGEEKLTYEAMIKVSFL
jgi:hypothetical protein